MEKVGALTNSNINSHIRAKSFAKFMVLLVLATFLPLVRQQFIVGSCVNAILFLSVVILGSQAAILIGLIPSLVSMTAGLLPAALAPVMPFIMVSNTILIITFAHLYRKSQLIGVAAASALKFIFLFSATSLIIKLILKPEALKTVTLMMGPIQLITALAGGAIASLLLAGIKSRASKQVSK